MGFVFIVGDFPGPSHDPLVSVVTGIRGRAQFSVLVYWTPQFSPCNAARTEGGIAATAQQLMDGLFRGSRLVVLHFDKSCLTTEAWWQGLLTLCPELSEVRERLP